jgi:TolB-like protein
MTDPAEDGGPGRRRSLLGQFRERGVLRVAASYAVIAWLLLQIADVILGPLGLPESVMTALIIAAVTGFPIAIALAWYFEIGPHGVAVDTAPAGAPRPVTRGLRHYADAIVIGALLITVVTLALRESDLAKPKPPENPAIAVLPFENQSGDPDQDYFSDGLSAEILDRLGRVPGLAVIARSSSFSFKKSGLDALAVAKRLGATTVLGGTVRRRGDRLRISAELVDAATGRQLWSGAFDRDIADVLRVQEELAAAVIDAVVPAARGRVATPAALPTRDLTAYDYYLLGRASQESRFGTGLRDAVADLEKAVEADPNFAKAHAALSRALVLWLGYPYELPPSDAIERAERAAHRALSLDPGSSEAHDALGKVFGWQGNKAAAEREYQQALQINPNNAIALWDYLSLLGDDPTEITRARELEERLARLDPRTPLLWNSRVIEAAEQRDAGKVASLTQQAIDMLADDPDGLRMVFFAARSEGYAPDAFRLNLAFARTGSADQSHFLAVRTWLLVDDLERARASAMKMEHSGNETEARVARYLQAEIAGIRGDFGEWERLTEQGYEFGSPAAASSRVYWLAVQERYEEAARKLAEIGPLPERAIGGLGSDLRGSPAVLRIYRATGRAKDADAWAKEYLEEFRQEPDDRLAFAELTANEGLDDQAVRTLEELFEQYPLVEWFHPELPWFRHLEGRQDYDRLLAERRRRMAQAHEEMLQLEKQATGTVLDPASNR